MSPLNPAAGPGLEGQAGRMDLQPEQQARRNNPSPPQKVAPTRPAQRSNETVNAEREKRERSPVEQNVSARLKAIEKRKRENRKNMVKTQNALREKTRRNAPERRYSEIDWFEVREESVGHIVNERR